MGNILPNRKTYILVVLGLISGLALYIKTVVDGGFNVGGFLAFINSEVVMAAIATVRIAIGKNK